jgi:flagellar biosynthesis/type III secretory pathway protein FliH
MDINDSGVGSGRDVNVLADPTIQPGGVTLHQ